MTERQIKSITNLSNHKNLKVKSKKSQNNNKQFKKNRLVLTIFRLAPKIISYARVFCKKLKKKNSHQILLFPASHNQAHIVSPDRNQSLIKQYQKKYKNDWYPFYFSNCNVFVDNHHLTLFTKKFDMPTDFSHLGLGKVICFAQFVNFDSSLKKQQKANRQSNSPLKIKRRQTLLQSLQSSLSQENINNLKNKIINGINSFTIPEKEQFVQGQTNIKNIFFMGTDTGCLLLIDLKTKAYASTKVPSGAPISSISIYKNYVMVQSKNSLHFYNVEANRQAIKITFLFSQKIIVTEGIYRPTFIYYSDFYFIFYIDAGTVKKIILKQRKLSNILYSENVCQPVIYNPFTNLKIYYQAQFKRILIIASCTKQILFYTYYFVENKMTLFYKLSNPKNPPMNPRVHMFSCIEFFSKTKKPQISQSQRNFRQSKKRNSKQYQQNINIINQENEFNSSQLSQNYLIIAVSFTERVYFIRVWENFCQLSKRAKFLHRVLKIQAYNDEGVILVLHKTQQKVKQWVVQQDQITTNQPQDATKPKLLFIATLLNKIMSFSICTHTQILQKIQFELEINTKATIAKGKFRTSLTLIDNQIMILTQNNIQRIEFNTWRDIYNRMLQTENLQLLTFLILLKKYNSLFLKAPQSFDSLQKFFPVNDDQTKQILLQYYYEIKQQPPQVFIDEILNKRPNVLLPFILQHKIDNLSENSKQFLIQYWKNKDKRIVEELIMAGCEFGWQIAIKQGWMRALRKMVMMGIQINFPLLKLSSFSVSEIQKLQKLDEIGNEDIEYETKCNEALTKINNYCLQMVQYTLLALEYFLDPQQIQQLDDLKQFILTLLRPQILGNCIKYKPHQSIKIISKIFQAQQRTVLLDKLSIQDFIHAQKQFKNIVRINYLSVSQCIFSYVSEIYRQLTQIKSYTIDQQTKFRQLLAVQHAKMIHISMQNGQVQGDFLNAEYKNKKGIFQFTRHYLLDMLLILVSHNNQYLKQLVHQVNVSVERDRQKFECYMQDLLVKIWMDAMESGVDNFQSDPNADAQPMTIQQIKCFMISLQQANTSNNYLLICLMLNLPKEQYCIKILRKFIYSQNIIIQQRLFDWLLPTMQNLQDQQSRLILQNQLMTHLKCLIEINKQKSRILFDKYFHNKQKQIIRRIDNDRPLQLQYLEMIIQDATQNEIQLQQNYLNLYLKLLISEQPQRVIKVLQESFTKQKAGKIKYDLPQALRYSLDIEQYNQKHQIQTYLYQKLGQIEKCITSYLKILQILFWQYIDAYESKQQKDVKNNQNQNSTNQNQQTNLTYEYKENDRMTKKLSIISQMISQKLHSKNDSMCLQLQQKISNYFKELTQLIFRQSIKKYQYLQIPLNTMISLSDLVKSQKLKYKGHYLGIIAFHFGKIIVQSFQKNWFQYFNLWLKNQTKINLNSMKKYLFQGYSKIISQQNLLTNISFIDKTVLLQNVREVLIIMEESVHCEAICTICNNNFQQYQGESILFSCGHLFHAHCIEKDDNGQDYCWQCIYNNQIKAMIDHEQINMVSLLERYCMKKSKNQMIENTKKPKQQIISITKKRMNRLGIFDKKVTTLENQVQILDMKLQILEYYESLSRQ